MIPVLLWLMATVDAGFIGYREAASRSALIDKRAWYRRAMLRGALFGQAAVIIAGIAIGASIRLSANAGQAIDRYLMAGQRMLIVFVPFALVVLATLAVRTIPSVDLRSITSVVVFGPLTLARPAVVVAGIAFAFYTAPSYALLPAFLLILTLMLGLERFIGLLRSLNWIE